MGDEAKSQYDDAAAAAEEADSSTAAKTAAEEAACANVLKTKEAEKETAEATKEEPVKAPTPAPTKLWISGDGRSTDGEKFVGVFPNKEKCMEAVKTRAMDDERITGVTYNIAGTGKCYEE